MPKQSWFVPSILVAFFVVLFWIFRKPAIPANAQIPAASTSASGATPANVPGPTSFAVQPPQLGPGIPALTIALQQPSLRPPLVNPTKEKLALPSFMVFNVPSIRDLNKNNGTPPAPKDCGCGGGCSSCADKCKPATALFGDGNGSIQLAATRGKQVRNTVNAQPDYFSNMASQINSIGFEPISLLMKKLNEVTS